MSPEGRFEIALGTPGTITPTIPSGVTPLIGGEDKVNFRWQADPNATWYRIWVNREGKAWQDRWIHTGTATGQLYSVFEWHQPGYAYEWWIKGWSPDGEGSWSVPLQYTTQ